MKTSFVSTHAMQTSLRLQLQTSQAELLKSQKEATTGKLADVGLALGGRTATTVDLSAGIGQMKTLIDTNTLVGQRLANSQSALTQMAGDGQSMVDALLTASRGDDTSVGAAHAQIKSALQSFTSKANAAANGEFLLAGTNTSQKPLDDYFDESGSTMKAAFDARFQSTFGFAQDDPAVSTIDAASMSTFLDDVETMFKGSEWQTFASSASSGPMRSRIAPGETIDSSTTTNGDGMRAFALAGVVGVELLDKGFSGDVRDLVVERTTDFANQAVSGITEQRSRIGESQARVSRASDALESRVSVATNSVNDLEGVDAYEAATRVNALLTQIETSYSLTARIQSLSLVNYL